MGLRRRLPHSDGTSGAGAGVDIDQWLADTRASDSVQSIVCPS